MSEPLDAAPPPHRAPGRVLALAAGIAALLAIIAGISILWIGSGEVYSFGWVGYAPLAEGDFLPGMYLLGPKEITGWALVAVGIACAAFLAGLTVGKRSR